MSETVELDVQALLNSTDEEILEIMADGKRWTAPMLADETNNRREYINTRLAKLCNYGLIERVYEGVYIDPEADRSGGGSDE